MELAPDITEEDLKVFLEEADEQLQVLDKDLIRLENEADNESLLQEIFRAAHTLKGSSAMVGHSRMSELAHAMESVLDNMRKGTLLPNSNVIDALLYSLDGLGALKHELLSQEDSEIDITPMISELGEAIKNNDDLTASNVNGSNREQLTLNENDRETLQTALAAGQKTFSITICLNRDTQWAAVRCFQVMTELSQVSTVICSTPSMKEIEEENVGFDLDVIVSSFQEDVHLKEAIELVSEVVDISISPYSMGETAQAPNTKQSSEKTAERKVTKTSQDQATQSQTVRIDVERLDEMMNMIGELVISSSRIAQIGKTLELKVRDDDLVQELGKSSSHTVKVVNELQENIMRARMLPIGTVFSGFPRMIRDLAQKSNKKVDFIVEGQETGIDRSVVEHVRDPLVHLLRNAVDHGIEDSEERKASGKPETAIVKLSACHEEGHIVITVEDDGKGIDASVVRKSAVMKGFISAEDAARMTDDEAINLIFGAGLSTAAKATEVSGRGVGLDIVRNNIEALNGYVIINTEVGRYTKFTLRLPLTLATIDSLLVTCNLALYAIPLVSVLEIVRLNSQEIKTISGREVIKLRGSVLPMLRLSKLLCMEQSAATTDLMFVVIVRSRDKQIGLAVDSLLGNEQIVVKSLSKHLGDVQGISGASILGNGELALIIDVPSLIEMATLQASRC